MLNRGQGVRTILATATRGDGGQNEIGPEIFDALAVLRTEELAALHRFDATEQYFTRAVDFGFSFSIEETMQKWGHDEILGDYVRLIRMTRPDVMLGMSPVANAGGFHHNTSGILSREAFKAAADPAKYPEQIREGLRPWQPKKYYYPGGGGPGGGRRSWRGGAGAPPARQHAPMRHRADTMVSGEECRGRSRGVRRAAGQNVRRDRRRRAQHAQVPGHGAAACRCPPPGRRSASS